MIIFVWIVLQWNCLSGQIVKLSISILTICPVFWGTLQNWLAVESNKVKASFTNNNITVFAGLWFNDKGELTNIISDDRYWADAGKQLPWATPLKDYQEINGFKLMGNAETIYSYPDRDLVYGTFKLVRIEYNGKEID